MDKKTKVKPNNKPKTTRCRDCLAPVPEMRNGYKPLRCDKCFDRVKRAQEKLNA